MAKQIQQGDVIFQPLEQAAAVEVASRERPDLVVECSIHHRELSPPSFTCPECARLPGWIRRVPD